MVSILAVPSAGGDTVPDLVNRIVPRLVGRGDLQLKLERQAAKWLGNAWATEQTRYDLEFRLRALVFFWLTTCQRSRSRSRSHQQG